MLGLLDPAMANEVQHMRRFIALYCRLNILKRWLVEFRQFNVVVFWKFFAYVR